MTEIKNPLLLIDIDGIIRREEWINDERRIAKIKCPFMSDNSCTYFCAAIKLAETKDEPMLGLICQAFQNSVPLGLIDMERIDVDKINSLKFGSDLREKLKTES